MQRIIGQLVEGFGTRALALGLAVLVGAYASDVITESFATVTATLEALP